MRRKQLHSPPLRLSICLYQTPATSLYGLETYFSSLAFNWHPFCSMGIIKAQYSSPLTQSKKSVVNILICATTTLGMWYSQTKLSSSLLKELKIQQICSPKT